MCDTTQGWCCPKCKRCYAPWMPYCTVCNRMEPVKYAGNNTAGEVVHICTMSLDSSRHCRVCGRYVP